MSFCHYISHRLHYIPLLKSNSRYGSTSFSHGFSSNAIIVHCYRHAVKQWQTYFGGFVEKYMHETTCKTSERKRVHFFCGKPDFFQTKGKMSCKTQWFDAWMAINNVLLATPHISLFRKNQSSDKFNRSGQNSNDLGLTISANWISLLSKNADVFQILMAFLVFAFRKYFMKILVLSSSN